MRKAALALLGCAYLFTSLAAAALAWRGGSDPAAGAAVLVGAFALCLALHGLVSRMVDGAGLRRELSSLRQAHRILADHLEETEGALEDLATRLEAETTGRAEALTSEVRMLEELVARMGEDLEARLARAPDPARTDRASSVMLETVRDALTENRVDLYLQPVVSLPQRRIVFYESFTRLRDPTGRVIMPAEYLSVAEPEGLISAIDNLLLFRCVQIVRRLAKGDRRIGIFCNISPASLADDRFFPQFLDFMAANKDLAGGLIFELGHAAFKARSALMARNMAKLADLGFRFSIDKVAEPDLDLADLQRADVRFAKIAAQVLLQSLIETERGVAIRGLRDLHAGDFVRLMRRSGVDLVVEKVENERQVIDVLELEAAYGQGHLFGEPRAIRDEVLAEPGAPAEFVQAPLRRAAAGR